MMACSGDLYNFMKFNDNNTHLNSTNYTCDHYPEEMLIKLWRVAAWAVFAIELPAVCTAIYALIHLIKANHVTPVYIINLLLSDLIQIISRPFFLCHTQVSSVGLFFLSILFLIPGPFEHSSFALPAVIFYFGFAANIGFMMCIALERYLLVVHPLWYQCHRTIKHSVLVSLAVWVAASIFIAQQLICVAFCMHDIFPPLNMIISVVVLILLPFAFLLFFFWATWRALSQSMLVSAAEKKRILGTLLLIMGNYTIFFIPNLIGPFAILHLMSTKISADFVCILRVLDAVCMLLVYLNPLMDILLYIFVRNGPNDSLRGFPCTRKQNHMIREDTVGNVSQSHRDTVL